jgi:hypothetical protein
MITFRGIAIALGALLLLSGVNLDAQRKGGGSVRQSRSTSSNAGANRSNTTTATPT